MNTVAQISTVASCVHTAWPRSEQLWRDVAAFVFLPQNGYVNFEMSKQSLYP